MTQKELAKLLGLSRATISLALQGDQRIASATRERVLLAAQQHGYRRDPMLSALTSYRSATSHTRYSRIWVVGLNDVALGMAKNEEINAAIKWGTELGYAVEKGPPTDTRKERFAHLARNANVMGLLVSDFFGPNASQEALSTWKALPCVGVGSYQYGVPFDRVCPDYFDDILRAVEQCHQRGYRRIGFVMPKNPARLRSDLAREAGMSVVRNDLPAGVTHFEPLYFPPGMSIQTSEPFLRWFDKNKPDVVVSFFAHVYGWMESAGIRIPDDCGFVWTHNLSRDEESWGAKVSGLRIANNRIGEEAIEWLDGKIRHKRDQSDSKGEVLKLISSTWNEGRSLPLKT